MAAFPFSDWTIYLRMSSSCFQWRVPHRHRQLLVDTVPVVRRRLLTWSSRIHPPQFQHVTDRCLATSQLHHISWINLETMLQQRDAHITNGVMRVIDLTVLLEKLGSDCLEKDTVGFLLCVAVCVNSSGNLVLELQGLLFLTMFVKPVHLIDNILTVLLTSSALAVDMFDGVTASGIVPFFSHQIQPPPPRSSTVIQPWCSITRVLSPLLPSSRYFWLRSCPAACNASESDLVEHRASALHLWPASSRRKGLAINAVQYRKFCRPSTYQSIHRPPHLH